jgi:transcription elongation GreA/GreB family factor
MTAAQLNAENLRHHLTQLREQQALEQANEVAAATKLAEADQARRMAQRHLRAIDKHIAQLELKLRCATEFESATRPSLL